MFHNNDSYVLKASQEVGDTVYNIYIPANHTEYHASRHVEATKQATYAGAGANEEVIQAHLKAILDRCNQAQSFEDFKTDITSITNALMYRTKYPVDQHCGVRMGCILSFMEYEKVEGKDKVIVSEDPTKTEFVWLQKKENLAFQHQELYNFFLTWGASNVPQWSNHLDSFEDREYFLNRMTTIRSMIPSDLLSRLMPV